MSSRNWQLRVRDILNAIAEIQEHTEGCGFEDFRQNSLLQKAVWKTIQLNLPPLVKSLQRLLDES